MSKVENKKLSHRWDLILRYRLIEIITLWEGRLITNHLQDAFGISRSQASKIINQYISEISTENLVYDKQLKGYIPTNSFNPKFTKGDISEYLNILNTRSDLTAHFVNNEVTQANIEVINPLLRSVNPEMVSPIIKACQQNQRIEIEYASLTSEKDYRNIAPHTLVFNGYRWHVRAYCEKSRQYRDFVLSRITNIYDFVGVSDYSVQQDTAWNTPIIITLKPDSRLSTEQQQVIAGDYGMIENRLEVNTRGAMVQYVLQFLRVTTRAIDPDPKAQQVIIENLEDVEKWLFNLHSK